MLTINIYLKDKLTKATLDAVREEISKVGGSVASSLDTNSSDFKGQHLILTAMREDLNHISEKIEKEGGGAYPDDSGKRLSLHIRNYLRCEAGDFTLTMGGMNHNLKGETLIMGILNVTPDSFSDGGRFSTLDNAVRRAKEMARDGAHIIDIGGESTRPGAGEISTEEELERVIPVIERLKGEIDIPISIDTYKAKVADKAITAGASMINDISGLRFDPDMAPLAAEHEVPVVLMHIKGTPRDMQKDPTYDDLIGEIIEYLEGSMEIAQRAGIDLKDIIIDPGIGFGKTWADNLTIIKQIKDFYILGCPILIGASRKSFIGGVIDRDVDDRLWGSIGAASAASALGAHMARAHDVKETKDALQLVDAIKRETLKKGVKE